MYEEEFRMSVQEQCRLEPTGVLVTIHGFLADRDKQSDTENSELLRDDKPQGDVESM